MNDNKEHISNIQSILDRLLVNFTFWCSVHVASANSVTFGDLDRYWTENKAVLLDIEDRLYQEFHKTKLSL